jgi:6-phosphogluconolactonase (cycloisomerase 2 family)
MGRHRRLWLYFQPLIVCLICLWPELSAPLAAQTHHYIYLASASSHTISGFELHQPNGALSVTPVSGSPFSESNVPSGVTFDPADLTFDPTGRFLFALDRDDSSVSAFSVDPSTGTLGEMVGSPFLVGGGFSPQFIEVDSTGNYLYVVASFTDSLQQKYARVSCYSIDSTGVRGVVDFTSPVLFSPVGIASRPGDKFIYVVGGDSSANVSILSAYLDSGAGTLVSKLVRASGSSPTSVALAPGGASCLSRAAAGKGPSIPIPWRPMAG